ncbi:MAG TPA: lysylphosphatidylglycerol synthase transmembrane domain-containing protein [Longimicrobiaceae bacterium]|nr:lysylphosphatidylglycerol synthase transmembrane domain-containing protein [Longimicrobiaceae bacterium]
MKFNLKAVLGIAVSLLLLWWALRDVSFAEVVHQVRNADPVLFGLSVIVATSGLAIRALRWEILLRPAAPGVPFRSRYAATSVGFAANNLLPARVGEFARAFTLGRLGGVPITAALASIVLERVLDGLVIVGLLFASMAVSSFPAGAEIAGVDPRAAARVLAIGTGAFGVALFLLALAPERSVAVAERVAGVVLPRSLRRPLVDSLRSFLGGLGVLRDPGLLVLSLLWAVGQWVFLAVSFLLAFRAFGIEQVPFAGAVFLQSLISLAVSIPSSPGFFGPWEAGARVGLALWGVPEGQAVSFAIGFHIGGFIPVTLIGLWYVWRLNLSWSEVEESEEVVEEIVERELDAPAAAAGGTQG